MTQRQVKPMVFLSAFQGNKNMIENVQAHSRLKTLVSSEDSYLECVGVYKGDMELSLGIVLNRDIVDLSNYINLAQTFKQESILYRDHLGRCYLLYMDDLRYESLGQWTEVDKEQAELSDAYTYAKVHGKHSYFVAV